MKLNKHLLILSPGFAASEEDDRCIPTLQAMLLAMQEQHPVQITVVAFQYPFRSQLYAWHKIPVYPLNGRNRQLPVKLMTWGKALRTIREIHANQPIDIIHSFWMGECALIGNLIAKKHSIPHLVTLMGQDALPQNFYLKLVRNIDAGIAALSQQQAIQFNHTTKRSVDHIIPFGLHPNSISATNDLPKKIDVLGVGALSSLKNFSAFIRVIDQLSKTNAAIKAVIVGEGEMKMTLTREIERLGLQQFVSLQGALSRKETLKLMQQSKVLLHLSKYESQGYVFSEALMNRCFIVSYAVGIAAPSSNWFVVKSEAEAVSAIEQALDQTTPDPLLMHHINDTAQHYYNWYNEKVG